VKHPAPDVIITGKYRLERPLASGGMGSVWVARHVELGLPVAIKFIGEDLASSGESRMRFDREAKAAALIQSPYVVSVQDYGVDDHLPYIVMELMRGEDLEERLRRRGRIPLHEASVFFTQIAKGLRRAHEMGIIHRDLKPRNLFIAQNDDEETIKILDFGIAKSVSMNLATESTTTGNIIGSPFYMSPEQIRGVKDLDLRTDLWSLGVVLFQMLTAKLPFRGEVVGDVIGKILADPIPVATQIAPDLPASVDGFFERALARDRTHRFQSAREMANALAEIARSSSPPRVSWHSTLPMAPATPSTPPKTPAQATLDDSGSGPKSETDAATLLRAMPPEGSVKQALPADSAKHTPASISIITERPPRNNTWKGIAAAVVAVVACTATVLVINSRHALTGATVESAPAAPLDAPSTSTPPADHAAPASDQASASDPAPQPDPASGSPQAQPQSSADEAARSAPSHAGGKPAAPAGAPSSKKPAPEQPLPSVAAPTPPPAKPPEPTAGPPAAPTVTAAAPPPQPPPATTAPENKFQGNLGF
jgi:serine/threonine protein kinase